MALNKRRVVNENIAKQLEYITQNTPKSRRDISTKIIITDYCQLHGY